ncbi:MAG: hypothetical protein V8Q84_10630, partial [Bilophila sp.]
RRFPGAAPLTWVGDVKQAIYGWRGGDATLFDEALPRPGPCCVEAPSPRIDTLPTNWRSCRAIVETNNALFRQLSDPATARAVRLAAMLPRDTPPNLLERLLAEQGGLLQEGFKGAEQQLAPGKGEGYVHLRPGVRRQKRRSRIQEIRRELLDCVDAVGQRRSWGDITVLVRSNGRAAQVAGWPMEEGIPVVTDNSFLLAEHPLVEQLTALLTFLDSPRDDLGLLDLPFRQTDAPPADWPHAAAT